MQAAREAAQLRWGIELSDTGRMRISFDSRALPLPSGTELRARSERYGTLLVWPDRRSYRVIAPGVLRTLLGERRADVTPLTQGTLKEQGPGERLELETRKLSLSSPLGSIHLELASMPEAGRGAPLLCRALVELMALEPSAPACRGNEVALAAELSWGSGDEARAGSRFVVDTVARNVELKSSNFAMAPARARQGRGLPSVPGGVFFTAKELESWRAEAVVPEEPATDPGTPPSGLVARNPGDRTLYLLLDGVPVTMLRGFGERRIPGLKAGTYRLQWRSFLGDFVEKPEALQLPARYGFAIPDAGELPPDAG
jgi:hypothetical protein